MAHLDEQAYTKNDNFPSFFLFEWNVFKNVFQKVTFSSFRPFQGFYVMDVRGQSYLKHICGKKDYTVLILKSMTGSFNVDHNNKVGNF